MSEDMKIGTLILVGLLSLSVILFTAVNIDQNRKFEFLQECIKSHNTTECQLLVK